MLGELLRSAIKIDHEQQESRKYIGISQIGYCRRKLYLQVVEKERPDISVDALFRFMKGNAGHEIARKLLWKMRGSLDGFTYLKSEKDIEIDCGNGYILKGHADLKYKIKDNLMIGDFKIQNPYVWNNIEEPSQHLVDQLTGYGAGENINDLELCFVNDSNGKDKTFTFKLDKTRVSYLKLKYRNLMKDIEKKTEPEPDHNDPDKTWECGYCFNYRNCWGERKFKKSDNTMEIPGKLVKQYIEFYKNKQEAEKNLTIIRDNIINLLQGSKGTSQNLSASVVIPKPKKEFNKKKFEKEQPVLYNQYLEDKKLTDPYYMLRTKGV